VLGALMGLGPEEVATTVNASQRGLGEGDLASIEIRGVGLAEARPQRFALPERVIRAGRLLSALPRPLYRALRRLSRDTMAVPQVLTAHCVACGLCVRHCPTGAAQILRGEKAARIDRNPCISCFCCQEFCESDAIRLTHRPVGALILFASGLFPAVRRALASVWQGLGPKPRGKRQV